MGIEIRCPECGEAERLKPRREGERIFIGCEACGHRWERHTDRCPRCGRRSLAPRRLPLLQKARGTQQSIIGYRMGKDCTACGWSSSGPAETSAV
jgi:ssDNA-binding Zn-finger/Zn-ribbon topoisomerase 1